MGGGGGVVHKGVQKGVQKGIQKGSRTEGGPEAGPVWGVHVLYLPVRIGLYEEVWRQNGVVLAAGF